MTDEILRGVLNEAHSSSKFNRYALHGNCGCYYCLEIFPVSEIKEFHSERGFEGATAICPHCGIDALLPDAGQFCPGANREFLKAMHERWFGASKSMSAKALHGAHQMRETAMRAAGWIT